MTNTGAIGIVAKASTKPFSWATAGNEAGPTPAAHTISTRPCPRRKRRHQPPGAVPWHNGPHARRRRVLPWSASDNLAAQRHAGVADEDVRTAMKALDRVTGLPQKQQMSGCRRAMLRSFPYKRICVYNSTLWPLPSPVKELGARTCDDSADSLYCYGR